DPGSVRRDVERNFVALANRLLDEGAAGFGEIAVLHLSLVERHPFKEVSSTHPLLVALAGIADQRKVVIDLHMDPVTADAMHTPASLSVPPNPPTTDGSTSQSVYELAPHPSAGSNHESDALPQRDPDAIRHCSRLADSFAGACRSLRDGVRCLFCFLLCRPEWRTSNAWSRQPR